MNVTSTSAVLDSRLRHCAECGRVMRPYGPGYAQAFPNIDTTHRGHDRCGSCYMIHYRKLHARGGRQ